MPRVKLNDRQPRQKASPHLVDELAHFLVSEQTVGQPLIYEYEFKTGLLRVLVVWDKWRSLSLERRTDIILSVYQRQGGQEVALASGLTMPEAVMAGFLLFRVIPALRKGDDLTLETCWQFMKDLGASELFDDEPRLYFATREEAEKMINKLSWQLRGSEEIWLIIREAGSSAQDDRLEEEGDLD